MEENIKVRWLTDHEQNKIAPKTLASQVLNEDGTLFKDTIATKEDVKSLYEKLESNTLLGFYCVEDVTVIVNGVSKTYSANSSVEISLTKDDIFEIIPTSDNSILALTAFPGALGTYYSWLEGVKQFSNILFDMNAEDMYIKWSQGNQGAYQVQFAQYTNCIFWSDNVYINDTARRTNYTLCSSSQLPLCYSNIPDNTFKAFYLAFNVNNDPNWSNPAYKESFAKATWATQAFSYYGARVVGYPGHDSSNFIITLPKDCRGLMFDARNIECAGTFDAANVTNFGAKQGSWKEAFGDCPSLRRLYIKNLKVNLNISWSPVDYASIYYIISTAANTNKITIFVSPYTWNLLSQSDFDFAASKNITIALITTNYVEDKRLNDIANKADKSYVDEKIAALVIPSVEGLATEEYVNEALLNIEENVQPDWNQNDELASDYIKNRPFYEGEDIEKDILPEVTYNCSTDSGITYIQTTDLTLNFKDGVMYDVYINEVVYTLKCNYITEGLKQYTLGDTEFSSAPFHIKYVPMISLFNITFNSQWKENKVTICIKERIKNIKKIERKFVNNIAGMDVEKKTFLIDNVEYTASNGAEIFNDYEHNVAVGQYSHAEGTMTAAMGLGSHVEGGLTTASGGASHSEGYHTTASGEASHAEGFGTTASGNWSHAEGEHTIARGENQHVQGSCNIEDAENRYAHIVGNGEQNARSNAYTLDWEGNAWYAGDVYVGSTSGTNKDEGSKKLLTADDLVQPDWNENDSSSAKYIENKPFGKSSEYNWVEILNNPSYTGILNMLDSCPTFTLGATYKVTFNDSDYICTCKYNQLESYYLGATIDFKKGTFIPGQDDDIPFCLLTADGQGLLTVRDSLPENFIIYEQQFLVNKLDEQFIPDTIARKEDIEKLVTKEQAVGKKTEGTVVTFEDKEYTCGVGTEIFNDLSSNLAIGDYSHAEGSGTVAVGMNTHAEGYQTRASGEYQHVQGKYNIEDTENKYAHIVGNGTVDDARSNAHTLDWDGNAWYAGSVECTSFILKSSTEGSNKRFRVTIDDNGELHTLEITE